MWPGSNPDIPRSMPFRMSDKEKEGAQPAMRAYGSRNNSDADMQSPPGDLAEIQLPSRHTRCGKHGDKPDIPSDRTPCKHNMSGDDERISIKNVYSNLLSHVRIRQLCRFYPDPWSRELAVEDHF